MKDLSYIENHIKEMLTEKRYQHSLGVQKTAIQLAKQYGASIEKASIAALIHDCAKDLSIEQLLKHAAQFDIIIDDLTKFHPELLHGAVGAALAKSLFSIHDEEIIDAVRYHTTGRSNMTMLDKIIYLADFIEPSRNFDGVDQLRAMASSNLDRATLMALEHTIYYVIKKSKLLHVDTIHARNFLLLRQDGLEQE
ncbi:bis(5'-nucleosyl)-tetraphosphatase (symmetrical) YqeK [Geosporobacter ferrireducens]|uniref:bis(5'-nucleosyl)-tetraphosphatase (symmetrical) n=1 Tax=Geosporobacter ferrireducens TaxID=1424294 RepID=A0A1D8GPR5_9FIRM|nr:bis(5'-nucleosyl)-tetraphosphatase (symmetrical) YqeK [Geosporobacter ferrireducens]AOT72774.1 phosphohydrolase [Geosporobacter ferrireducens]MTI55190.1 HD domain-containing protein [Geosporobacter ferrireducens]